MHAIVCQADGGLVHQLGVAERSALRRSLADIAGRAPGAEFRSLSSIDGRPTSFSCDCELNWRALKERTSATLCDLISPSPVEAGPFVRADEALPSFG